MKLGSNPEIDIMIAGKILAHEVVRNQAGKLTLEFAEAATDTHGKPIDIKVTVEAIDHVPSKPANRSKRGAHKNVA